MSPATAPNHQGPPPYPRHPSSHPSMPEVSGIGCPGDISSKEHGQGNWEGKEKTQWDLRLEGRRKTRKMQAAGRWVPILGGKATLANNLREAIRKVP